MKSLKNLFIKEDAEEEGSVEGKEQEAPIAFPISDSKTHANITGAGSNQYLVEIIDVYEKGLESINMPGYDFYDFYLAIKASGAENEAVFKMAYQMGKTMDKTVTPQKLSNDAEYYISKLNEVYQTYSQKGEQKLHSLESELKSEKNNLSVEANGIESDINKMRQQISQLEQKLTEVRSNLARIDGKYDPQKEGIKLKLQANDHAMKISVQKLQSIKEGILKYIK